MQLSPNCPFKTLTPSVTRTPATQSQIRPTIRPTHRVGHEGYANVVAEPVQGLQLELKVIRQEKLFVLHLIGCVSE